MAITVTLLAEEAFTNNTQTQNTTYSLTPVSGRRYVAVVAQSAGTNITADAEVVTHLGGTPLTMSLIASSEYLGQNGSVAAGAKLFAYQGVAGGTETAGAIRSDTGRATNNEGHIIALIELTGVDTSTPFPQATGTQSNNNASATLTSTLGGALAGTDSVVISVLLAHTVSTDWTGPTGWTTLSNVTSTGPTRRMRVSYATNDGSADWSGLDTGGTADYIVMTFEVKAAAGVAGGGSSSATVVRAQVRKIQVVPA